MQLGEVRFITRGGESRSMMIVVVTEIWCWREAEVQNGPLVETVALHFGLWLVRPVAACAHRHDNFGPRFPQIDAEQCRTGEPIETMAMRRAQKAVHDLPWMVIVMSGRRALGDPCLKSVLERLPHGWIVEPPIRHGERITLMFEEHRKRAAWHVAGRDQRTASAFADDSRDKCVVELIVVDQDGRARTAATLGGMALHSANAAERCAYVGVSERAPAGSPVAASLPP